MLLLNLPNESPVKITLHPYLHQTNFHERVYDLDMNIFGWLFISVTILRT